jgi:beta-glucosidase
VLGLDPTLEGEEGDAVASSSGGDRARIELPPNQLAFLQELRRNAKKLVLVLTGGSALAVPEAHEFCDAVLQVWYPGCEGGRAVADVLFGAVSPSGKLPITVPRRTEDLPPFNDYAMRGRTYRFATVEPLYPFGFGLSYVRFAYENIELSADRLAPGQGVVVRTTVRNTGARDAAETVQCYLVPPSDWPEAPRATLVAFQKVLIPAGTAVTVEFALTEEAFQQVDATGQRVRVPGRYEIVVGPASPGPRAVALGAPSPVTATVTLSAG